MRLNTTPQNFHSYFRRGQRGGINTGTKFSDYIFNNPDLKQRRKELRNNSTPAEIELWKRLKNKALCGRKFRRQYSVGKFVLDFYCTEERLGIELDGALHFEPDNMNYDKLRTEIINTFSIKIIRFENYLIMEDIEMVLEEIKNNFKK